MEASAQRRHDEPPAGCPCLPELPGLSARLVLRRWGGGAAKMLLGRADVGRGSLALPQPPLRLLLAPPQPALPALREKADAGAADPVAGLDMRGLAGARSVVAGRKR